MDPNACLTEIRSLVSDSREGQGLGNIEVRRLTDLCEALDEWIGRGGFLPSDWAPSWSLIVSWEPDPGKRTEWHPTDQIGPFSVLTRGNFESPAKAIDWAHAHLGGSLSYSLRPYYSRA